MKKRSIRTLVIVTLPAIAVLLATVTPSGPSTTGERSATGSPSESVTFPFSARYVETIAEDGKLLARSVYQFTGRSWDDFTGVLLSSNDAAGPVSQSHIGHVTRYKNGELSDAWLVGGSNEFAALSMEEVNALLGGFPGNAESVKETTVPGGEQAPSPLFNRRWLKFEGLSLPSGVPADGAAEVPIAHAEPETSTAIGADLVFLHTDLSNPDVPVPEAAIARLLDLPARSVVTVTGGDGSSIHVESRKEIVFALGSGIPLAGRVTFGPIVETLLVTELGPPAPAYAEPVGSAPGG